MAMLRAPINFAPDGVNHLKGTLPRSASSLKAARACCCNSIDPSSPAAYLPFVKDIPLVISSHDAAGERRAAWEHILSLPQLPVSSYVFSITLTIIDLFQIIAVIIFFVAQISHPTVRQSLVLALCALVTFLLSSVS